MGFKSGKNKCTTVGIQGIAWAFGGMIFTLVYCTAGISGGHINPVVTFGLFLARKLSLVTAIFYMAMQCLRAICDAGIVKGFMGKSRYNLLGGGTNFISPGYTKGDGLGTEIVGTFILFYTIFSATDAKWSARDSHVPIFYSRRIAMLLHSIPMVIFVAMLLLSRLLKFGVGSCVTTFSDFVKGMVLHAIGIVLAVVFPILFSILRLIFSSYAMSWLMMNIFFQIIDHQMEAMPEGSRN